MKTALTRRSFLQYCTALGIADALGWSAWASEPAKDEVFPGWKPGEMDLHFIYTGCGENMFYRLPDGTAILNDCGDFYRPRDLKDVPLLPSPERVGGEWVNRYIHRVYGEKQIDYLIFSHWHGDHVGHARYDIAETPGAAFRSKTLPDGRRINGFRCVAEDYSFRRYFDHQYPGDNRLGDKDMTVFETGRGWAEAQRKNGLVIEPFKVGALDQIKLLRDPAKYAGAFSVRNVCANGVAWDGKDGTHDYLKDYLAASKKKRAGQNMLSMGFVMRYGKFSYFTGGDIQHDGFRLKNGGGVDYEGLIGEAVGPVTFCKMNHHGCTNGMGEKFLKAVRAQVYTACMWCPGQAHPQTIARMLRQGGPAPMIVPNLVTRVQQKSEYKFPYSGAAHVVVKVLPGGNAYRVYLLRADDESMRVLAKFDRTLA